MEKHKTKPVEQDFLTQETGLKPVFIVGMPRTGSKIYQFAINDNSEVKISHEIFFLAPQWSRKDVQSIIRDEIGALDNDQSLEQLADMIFARKFNGTYWNLIDGDRQKFLKLLRDCDRSSKAVLKCILEFDALKDGKSMIGAKFPVHITDANTLLNWFPGARIVHLNRNPLAIYSSQKKKHGRGAKSFPGKIISLLKVLLGTVASYRSSTRFYLKHHQKENYALFNYEDLVQDPEAQIRRLCQFIGVEYKDEMLNLPYRDSSYDRPGVVPRKSGIRSDSMERWKKEVNIIEQTIFSLFSPNFTNKSQ